jgi:hypothetical protein
MRKAHALALAVGLAGSFLLSGTTAHATLEISATVQINAVSDFTAPLAAEGDWVSVGHFGQCWHPRGVAADWRPYCNGQWVWTDNGWYWQSDEPWAWACYHYGTWDQDPTYGWIWVPATEWAPAWVVWRSGGGYTGWAPCAPRGVKVRTDVFGFVETAHMTDRVEVGAVHFNDKTIYRKTSSVKQATHETRTVEGKPVKAVINKGPGVAEVQKATGREVKPVAIQEAHARTKIPETVTRKAPATTRPAGNEQRPGNAPQGKEEEKRP